MSAFDCLVLVQEVDASGSESNHNTKNHPISSQKTTIDISMQEYSNVYIYIHTPIHSLNITPNANINKEETVKR